MRAALNAASGGTLQIDLDAICDNYKTVKSKTKADVSACVKADGYGLGLTPVAAALSAAGCKTFFVASVEEGGLLRSTQPDATIYVLNGLFSGAEPAFVHESLRPCLSSLEEVQEWSSFCAANGAHPAALHGDTGIHRLGFDLSNVEEIFSLSEKFNTTLLMSHLACADEAENQLNAVQLDRFQTLQEHFPDTTASLCNTAGVFLGPDFHFDLVRPGIGLYGGNPFGSNAAIRAHPFKPVVTLSSRIMRIAHIEPGAIVGYGATFVAKRPTRVATLAAGYADGYFRALGSPDGQGHSVLINGKTAPIIGRISMDMITVDVTDLPQEAVKRGQFAELIGPNLTIGDIGRASGTIGYEVLTRLGYRYRRTYTSTTGISSV
jgi:alanine racemase